MRHACEPVALIIIYLCLVVRSTYPILRGSARQRGYVACDWPSGGLTTPGVELRTIRSERSHVVRSSHPWPRGPRHPLQVSAAHATWSGVHLNLYSYASSPLASSLILHLPFLLPTLIVAKHSPRPSLCSHLRSCRRWTVGRLPSFLPDCGEVKATRAVPGDCGQSKPANSLVARQDSTSTTGRGLELHLLNRTGSQISPVGRSLQHSHHPRNGGKTRRARENIGRRVRLQCWRSFETV